MHIEHFCGGTKKNRNRIEWKMRKYCKKKSRESKKVVRKFSRLCVLLWMCEQDGECVCVCFFNAGYLPMFRLYEVSSSSQTFLLCFFLVCATENSSNCSNHESNGSIDHIKNAQCMEMIACIECRCCRLFNWNYVSAMAIGAIPRNQFSPTFRTNQRIKPFKFCCKWFCARGLVYATRCVHSSFFCSFICLVDRSVVHSFEFIFVGRVPISDYWYLLVSQLHA